jgi:2-oxoglutarate dehydrogenase E2 component (dihydrolipoamide succinyltransferase)
MIEAKMHKEIHVPPLGESVSEATIAKWLKNVGDVVVADETVVELETDKITLEINAPVAGVLEKILLPQGSRVKVGDIIGIINSEGSVAGSSSAPVQGGTPSGELSTSASLTDGTPTGELSASPVATASDQDEPRLKMSPSVRKIVDESGVDPREIEGSGKGGRLTKADVQEYLDKVHQQPLTSRTGSDPSSSIALEIPLADERVERVPMSRLRQRIAERLKSAQNTAAMLTTFNEIDMSTVMAMRAQYREAFEKKYGVRLGFMSFFVKACVAALQEIPAVNAEIDGTDIIYKKYYDIGVAVSAPQGLVVPVLRGVDALSFAEVEKKINELSLRARENKLAMTDLTGGTFTITNGGVFGSLMSTPILNPPQSGILGMHKIQERPVVINGKIDIRPMMYVALTYDHRIIDGREAVTFLVKVKEFIENPERLLLGI